MFSSHGRMTGGLLEYYRIQTAIGTGTLFVLVLSDNGTANSLCSLKTKHMPQLKIKVSADIAGN